MRKFLRTSAKVYLLFLFIALTLSFFFWTEAGLELNSDEILQSSSWKHPFGTDSLGRDLGQRLLQGGQVSVAVGLLTTFFAFLIGVTIGTLAGWYEGHVDRFLMRFVDIVISIPGFVLVSILCLFLQNLITIEDIHLRSFFSLVFAISCTHWMGLARVTRGLVMETKRQPYIEAAEALGMRTARILMSHIFPNIRSRIVTLAAMQISTNIMYESFMSFIGLGVRSPWTSWGLLVHEGWKTMSSFPHLILYPSLALFLTVWSLNLTLVNDQARD